MYKPWKQTDQILLLRILHIKDKIFKGIWETRANGERFLYIANTNSVGRRVKRSKLRKASGIVLCRTRTCAKCRGP
jgi:hypothetical protein